MAWRHRVASNGRFAEQCSQPFVVWNGQGNAASFCIAIPVTPALVGLELFAQGFVADLNPAAPLAIGLTEGVAARIQ